MSTLSPPPMRHRASSTNLRPALTISTLGPRPKACALLDSIPATPPVTAEPRKMSPTLASPSRLSALLEQCWDLLRVDSYLPSHSTTPSSPLSPSDDSVLPMSSTTTVCGDDVEDEKFGPLKVSSSRPWWRNTPSVCSYRFHAGHTSAYPFATGSCSHLICDHHVPSIDRASSPYFLFPSFPFHVAPKPFRSCAVGPRASRLLPKRRWCVCSCYWYRLRSNHLDARLVHPWERLMGKSLCSVPFPRHSPIYGSFSIIECSCRRFVFSFFGNTITCRAYDYRLYLRNRSRHTAFPLSLPLSLTTTGLGT
jgi:hypothetical protein